MIYKKTLIIQTLLVFLFLVFLFFIITSSAKPWEARGQVVLAVRATSLVDPNASTFGIGIDNVELYHTDTSKEKITVRTRRITLDPRNNTFEIVLNDTVPVGTYSGFGFTLKSPEIRNNWEEDIAPKHVTLLHEHVTISSPFHVEKDKTSALLLVFETHEAIHDKEGTQLYLPVIQVETRFDTTAPNSENQFDVVQGGIIESSATYGMDWDGLMHFNFRAKSVEEETTEIPQKNTEENNFLQLEATSTLETENTTATTTEIQNEVMESESVTETTENDDEALLETTVLENQG
jgi:hypothetical protein